MMSISKSSTLEQKTYYTDGLWSDIINHPDFDLGRREFASFRHLVHELVDRKIDSKFVIHLGPGDGRECTIISEELCPRTYILVDRASEHLEKAATRLHRSGSRDLHLVRGDMEQPHEMQSVRLRMGDTSTLWLLVGNGSILSAPTVDGAVFAAMRPGDRIAVALEAAHPGMYESYRIPPVLRFLSQSGVPVEADNTIYRFDQETSCLQIWAEDRLIFASYKPSPDELVGRIRGSGLKVAFVDYDPSLFMISGCFIKG
jgi:hypothetical protein